MRGLVSAIEIRLDDEKYEIVICCIQCLNTQNNYITFKL